jgi:hypothetical protein
MPLTLPAGPAKLRATGKRLLQDDIRRPDSPRRYLSLLTSSLDLFPDPIATRKGAIAITAFVGNCETGLDTSSSEREVQVPKSHRARFPMEQRWFALGAAAFIFTIKHIQVD